MGVEQLLIDFLLGPLSLIDVVLNLNVLLNEIEFTLRLFEVGQGERFFDALINGRTFIGKAVTGFFGTMFWLGVLGSAA
jgi:hypothetical protein